MLLAQVRQGDSQRHDDGRDELETLRREVQPQGDGDDETVDYAARHRADDLERDAAAAEDRLADDERSEADDDVGGLLILREDRARERRDGVRGAQADRDGHARVDGARAHHVGVIARGADGEPQPCAQKQDQQHAHHRRDGRGEDELIRRRAAEEIPEHGENRVGLEHVHVGRKTHHREVHRVKSGVRDDAREDGRHAQPRLQQSGDEARRGTGQHGQRDPKDRVPRHGQHGGHRAAQRERSVRGHIRDIQDAEAQKQRHRDKSIDKAQLQRAGDDIHTQHVQFSFYPILSTRRPQGTAPRGRCGSCCFGYAAVSTSTT